MQPQLGSIRKRKAIDAIATRLIVIWSQDPLELSDFSEWSDPNLFGRLLAIGRGRNPIDFGIELGKDELGLLEQLRIDGWQLLTRWPRPWGTDLFEEPRLILGRGILEDHFHFRSIVSSVLKNHGIDSPIWRSYFEKGLLEIKRDRATLVVSTDVAIGDRVSHAAKRLEIACRPIHFASLKLSIQEWLVDCIGRIQMNRLEKRPSIWISPGKSLPAEDLHGSDRHSTEQLPVPIADRVVCLLPDRLYVLGIRKKGRLQRVLTNRLSNPLYQPGQVRIPLDASLAGQESIWTLDSGAVGWWLAPTNLLAPSNQLVSTSQLAQEGNAMVPIESSNHRHRSLSPVHLSEWLKEERANPWLIHCTRTIAGRWPDESELEYQDRLLRAAPRSRPTQLESLIRILEMSRLVAATHLKRSDVPTVCFSSVPLDELLARRTYQSHLHRWDWEPYGVCFRQGPMERLGARACLYGEESRYLQLAERDRPFFQLQKGNKNREVRKTAFL